MYLISAEAYKNAGVHCLKIKKTDEIWVSMKDCGSGLGVKNISDLVLKEIYGIDETKNLTKEEIKNYEMIEKQIYKKFDISVKMNKIQRVIKMTVCSCHVTYVFQSEFTLYIYLNAKELLTRNRRDI